MSKDGDWIVRESADAIDHVLRVLEAHGARYRFWCTARRALAAGGWSSHFEFRRGPMRLRCDFVSRPPRIPATELHGMWNAAERPALAAVERGRDALEEALDRERRELMRANEERLQRYEAAAAAWGGTWTKVQREIESMPLLAAHRVLCEHAAPMLPFQPTGGR